MENKQDKNYTNNDSNSNKINEDSNNKNSEVFNFTKHIINDIILQFNLTKSFTEKIDFLQNSQNFNNEISKYLTEVNLVIDNTPQKLHYFKSLTQNSPALCGFHCLFNIVNYLRYLKIKNNSDVHCELKTVNSYSLLYLEKMNSSVKFWKFYKKITNFILSHMHLDESAIKLLKSNGPLERYQIKFVLERNLKIKHKISNDGNTSIHFFRFFFGFNIIQGMNKGEIVHLQEALEKMKNYNGKIDLVYVILLGITNHWSVLILNKKGEDKINFTYLDSLNINVFNFDSENEIEEFVERRFREREKLLKRTPSEWLRKCFGQWIKDINFTLTTFYRILLKCDSDSTKKLFSFYSLMILEIMKRVISTFEKYNKLNLEEEIDTIYAFTLNNCENELLIENLYNWLNNEYHPKILYEDIIKTIDIFKYANKIKQLEIFNKINGWINFSVKLKEKLNFKENTTDTKEVLILRYFDFINHLVKLLEKTY